MSTTTEENPALLSLDINYRDVVLFRVRLIFGDSVINSFCIILSKFLGGIKDGNA